MALQFIRPRKPVENAFIESFNGKFRDECLNTHWFTSLNDAQRAIETWRVECNEERTHKNLDRLTPAEFIKSLQTNPSPHRLTA